MLTQNDFVKYLTSQSWYKSGLSILCACSGGADSTVLLHLLLQMPGLKLAVIHVDHQLRGMASTRDREFVRQMAHANHLPYYAVSIDVAEYARQHGLSIEEAGSRLRRQTFLEKLDILGYDFVMTAQHGDDQLETVLMNLLTGTGIRGLAGIRRQSERIIRPLLPWSRTEILQYASGRKLDFVTDESNRDQAYLRNRIRLGLLPFLRTHSQADILQDITRLQSISERLLNRIDKSLEDIDNKDIMVVSSYKISLGMRTLSNYFSAIQKAIFDKAFQIISGAGQGLSQKHFSALIKLIKQSENGQYVQLPGGVQASREWQQIILYKPADLVWPELKLSEAKDREYSFFSIKSSHVKVQSHLKNPFFFWLPISSEDLTLRPIRTGDYLVTNNNRHIPVRKLLQDARVAPHLRDVFPVLVWANQEVLWVPGIRTAQAGLIDPEAIRENEMRACLQISFRKGSVHADTRS